MKSFTPSKNQILAARKILDAPSRKFEDHIRGDIVRLLDEMQIESISPYPTDDGPADIYLPRLRLFIETKASGLVNDPNSPQPRDNNETPKEQLERYIFSEIRREKGMLDLDGNLDRRWVGILTDGHVWHAWLYDHSTSASAREEFCGISPTSPEELIQRISILIADGPIGKPWIPANPRSVFENDLQQLQNIYDWLPSNQQVSLDTKIELWLELLRTAGMEPENDSAKHRLFVRHTFLVCLAKGIVDALASTGKVSSCKEVFDDGFVAWITKTLKGQEWGDTLLKRINEFEWRRRRGDVLRGLYEELIEPEDRKRFGEYYTPEWLAEWLVEEVLDDEWCDASVKAALVAEQQQRELQGVGVLDPTCGSGTFLYFATKKILSTPSLADLSPARKSTIVAKIVNGIDVHPVAAEISRATILRALPTLPSNGKSDIRVYEGDSLLTTQYDESSLFYPRNGEVKITTPRGAEVVLPKSFVDDPLFRDNLRRMMLCASKGQNIPSDILMSVSEADKASMKRCHEKFIDIIHMEGNSVWTWFISNTAGPFRLAQQKVNRIVANPPWVKMADIQSKNRKQALENFAKFELEIWNGGKQAPHFDIAQLFIKRSRQLYLNDQNNDPAVWIVKRTVFRGGNWESFRNWHERYLAQSIDMEKVQVFGGGDARRCCVLFDIRKGKLLFSSESSRVIGDIIGSRPSSQMSLNEARKLLEFEAIAGEMPRIPSDYVDHFRQGATVTPSVLLVVKDKRISREGNIFVTTEKSTKSPWNSIDSQTGEIPKHWLRELVKSKRLLPFAISDQLLFTIVPTDLNGKLLVNPESESPFWDHLDAIYQENAGIGRSTPKSLINQINFSNKLDAQLKIDGSRQKVSEVRRDTPRRKLGGRQMVLYPQSGDHMRAARCSISTSVADNSLYRYIANSEEEAAYLVGILNAQCLGYAFQECRTSGRNFHLNPLKAVPIERYNRNNKLHKKIAEVSVEAEAVTNSLLKNLQDSRSKQVALSKLIRENLTESGLFDKLDCLVRKILPNHAR